MKLTPRVRRILTNNVVAYLYILPALLILSVFVFYPVVKSLHLSFYDWDMISPAKKFVGLANYKELLTDDAFHRAVANTVTYVAGTVPVGVGISLGIALLLNSRVRFRGGFRTMFFVPYVTSFVAISIVWKWIYNDQFGLLNHFLESIGMEPRRWLVDSSLALIAVMVVSIWRHIGYNAVIFLAGLQNVDKSLYEAARVDGASDWQVFWRITLPLLSPTTYFILLISMIGAFKVFTEVYVLFTGGTGPLDSALTIVFYIYEKAFRDWRMGYASAGAYVLFLIIFVLTLVQMRLSKRRVFYS